MDLKQELIDRLGVPENWDKYDYQTQRYSFDDVQEILDDIVKKLTIPVVSQQSELFAEQDSKDFVLWQRDREIRRLENGKYKWREFEYNREFFLEKYLEYRNKANCG